MRRQHEPERYRSYLLGMLVVILAFNCVDRLALGLLLQDIKLDLGLSDTQLGLLSGIAFAFFYSVMGIPIARWADRGNRVVIISATTALWSAAVALCGLAGNFWQLLLIRIGVAVGEAGCIPPAHSLIADHFGRAERPRAVARYMLGAPFSAVIGYFLGGWLNELYGWRTTFMVLGLPGVALAALVWITLREPRRYASSVAHARQDEPPLNEVCLTLWRNATFLHLLLCFSVLSFFSTGILKWLPTFFIRSYELQTGELGTWFALIHGLGGAAGLYFGGELASRFATNDESAQLKVMAVAYCGLGVLWALVYLADDHRVGLALVGLATLVGSAALGPLFATIQTLVPGRMRALSIAVIYLFANLIGMGLGPLAAGMLSDAFRSWAGDESLRYALLVLCPGYAWGAWHAWRASYSIGSDLELAAETR
jgi:predicted MFS family arabinose efflux permease